MNAILLAIAILTTLFFPIPATILNLTLFMFSKRYKLFYGILLSVSLATIAYVWKPTSAMDLFRWHNVGRAMIVRNPSAFDISSFLGQDADPLKYFVILMTSRTGDLNLMQFLVTFLNYAGVTFILADIFKRNKYNTKSFALACFFVLSSCRILYAISGLWHALAVMLFSVGFYLNSERQSRYIHWVFYVLATLAHSSILLLVIPFILSKIIKKRKNNQCIYLVAFLFVAFIGPFLTWIDSIVNMGAIHNIYRMYTYYFVNADYYAELHGGWALIRALSVILTGLLVMIGQRGDAHIRKYNFKMFTIITVLAILMTGATVFIRHACLVAIMIAPDIMRYIDEKTEVTRSKTKMLILATILLCSVFNFCSQVLNVSSSGILRDAIEEADIHIFNIGDNQP